MLLLLPHLQSTLAPAPGGRSRALTTQYKLDQLEKQRELQAAKRKQKGGVHHLSSFPIQKNHLLINN